MDKFQRSLHLLLLLWTTAFALTRASCAGSDEVRAKVTFIKGSYPAEVRWKLLDSTDSTIIEECTTGGGVQMINRFA